MVCDPVLFIWFLATLGYMELRVVVRRLLISSLDRVRLLGTLVALRIPCFFLIQWCWSRRILPGIIQRRGE